MHYSGNSPSNQILKHLSQVQKKWLRAHALLEAKNRLRESRGRKAIGKKLRKPYRILLPHLVIRAPDHLDFEANYEQTTRFLEQIRRTFVAGGHRMLIWMTKCAEISPEAALVLGAEIERCKHHRPGCINGNNPTVPAISAMLRDIGFHKLLNFSEPSSAITSENETKTYLQMKTGVQGSGHHADDLRALVLGQAATTSDQLRDDLVRGLNEAVLNVHQHAYEEGLELSYPPMPNKRWWIAGYRDASVQEIGFLAYDQGAGIPASMLRNHRDLIRDLAEAVSMALSGEIPTRDHLLVQRAFEVGTSRTRKPGRGNGLDDFKRFLRAAGGNGSLRVLSGRGSYVYHLNGEELIQALPVPFHGTLIIWRLTGSPAVQWESAS